MDREGIGPYRLLGLVGKGGMGAVFEAVHQTIERRAAIKILHPEFASNQEYAERFLNEARAVNRIRHPNIVEIYDLGTMPDGTTYLVMEFLDGETLGGRLQRHGGTLPLLDILWIAHEIANALSCSHQKGIIHRDLKPENVMLIADAASITGERVKLLDFGIAKLAVSDGQNKAATQIGTVMGTLSYMPPEQLRDTAHVTDRADVYALGALLYHLASGRPPFVAISDIDLMTMHLRDAALPIEQVAPEIPATLARLINQMLGKDPLLRPSMEEVDKCLVTCLRSTGSIASGQQSIVAAAPPNRGVPETLVRRTGSLASAAHSSSQETPAVAPSASTLSGSASQSALLRARWAASKRMLFLTAAVGVPVLLVLFIGWHQRTSRTATVSPPVVQSPPPAPVPIATPLAPSPPPAQPLTAPAAPSSPEEVTPSTRPEPPTPAKPPPTRGCLRTSVGISCLANSPGKLTPGTWEATVKAARTAEIKPCIGQTLRAVREGKKMLFEPSRLVSTDQAQLFSDTLRGLLGRELPAEVSFRCSK